jgi:hypothetical protein
VRLIPLILIPPILLFILALALILMPLPHPFPEAKSPERTRVAAITTGILGMLYLVGLTVYAVSWFLQVSQTLDPALEPLGLTAEGAMGFGRRYHGELDGRQVEIAYQPPQTIRAALLNITVDAEIGTRAAMAPKRPLLDCADCPAVDAGTPDLSQFLVVAEDPAWMKHLLAEPANAAALSRLLVDQETPGTRELYFQPECIWLRAHPRQLTEDRLRQWLDDLLILAEAAEANIP